MTAEEKEAESKAVVKKEPLSLEELIAKRKAEEEASSKVLIFIVNEFH